MYYGRFVIIGQEPPYCYAKEVKRLIKVNKVHENSINVQF